MTIYTYTVCYSVGIITILNSNICKLTLFGLEFVNYMLYLLAEILILNSNFTYMYI